MPVIYTVMSFIFALAIGINYFFNKDVKGVREFAIAMGLLFLSYLGSELSQHTNMLVITSWLQLISYIFIVIGLRIYAKLTAFNSQYMRLVITLALILILPLFLAKDMFAVFALSNAVKAICVIYCCHALWKLSNSLKFLSYTGLAVWALQFLTLMIGLYAFFAGDKYLANHMALDLVTLPFYTILSFSFIVLTTEELSHRLEKLALYDHLSGLFNRRAFEGFVMKAISHAERAGDSFALLMLDMDKFKNVNDTYGHDAGDYVIQQFAEFLQAKIRPADICARFGGEEFMVLVKEAEIEMAQEVAERLRYGWENHGVNYQGQEIICTVSIGGVIAREGMIDFDSLAKETDLALYQAKENGRNQVVFQ